MTLAEITKPGEVNYNIIIPVIVSICGSLLVLFALWDRVKRCFADKRVESQLESLESRVHLLEIWKLTNEKKSDRLDDILEAITRKQRGRND